MTLFSLLNQNINRQLLLNIIRNERVANAYLFYGSEGSGHEGFAFEFAAMLNCESEGDRPCKTCPSCKRIKMLEHPDLQLVFPIPIKKDQTPDSSPFRGFTDKEMEEIQNIIKKKAENPYEKISIPNAHHIPINFIRDIKKKIYLSSHEGGWRVTIILDAHLMTEQASNAFLKILEEPPPKSTFILTTSAPENIIPTIRSRCQPIFFPRLPASVIESSLSSAGIADDKRKLVIQLSSGDYKLAMDLAEIDIRKLKDTTLDILRSVAVWNIEKIYHLVDMLSNTYKEEPEYFLQVLSSLYFWFRDAMIIKLSIMDAELIHSDLSTELHNFVKAYPNFDVFKLITSVDNCIDFINKNVYINLAILNMFIKMNEAILNREG